MRMGHLKFSAFSRNVWNGMLGIAAEIAVTALFILIGIAVSLIWWGVFKF
jgi:hypothetical protein